MSTTQQLPWAILLCKYSDDSNIPSKVTISDLYQQWSTEFGPNWISQNLQSGAASDGRTILEVYDMFFTPKGAGTFNAVRYWDEMSHGSIDISGTKVFPCTLDITKAKAAALAVSPGGAKYQEDIFKRAKSAWAKQHAVNSADYYGIAVSFTSPDYGAQGGTFDGGPGVFMDLRYVLGNGIQAWGQEMGHAFGLDHSRQQGSNADYQDMWDVMSTRNAFSAADGNYGMRGPGLNAWNMRGRQWLNEARVWRGSSANDFSEFVQIRPLHRRDLGGDLAAELPAIGGDSAYLVELRVREAWDSAIPKAAILVHRFDGPIGQNLGTHSYLMKGTNGQVSLVAGEVFELGTGPFSRVKVVTIDEPSHTATIELCHSLSPKFNPSVTVGPAGSLDDCRPKYVEGEVCKFVYNVTGTTCMPQFKVLWNVSGTTPLAAGKNDGQYFEVLLPDPSILVEVSASVTFDDGSVISDSVKFHSISRSEADWREFACRLLRDRRLPNPWWQWNPADLRPIMKDYSAKQLALVEQRMASLLRTIRQVAKKSK